ncbi:histone deacetylase [Bremerella cremea]|uniref:Histone deacetylase n=1 Tax=Bremerella cremea TaxID=1031537 RepID=A0A368KQX9_9BACT|nr:histone deacetylase [Bremerella cremea]RCS46079.1 histone deacetylase [Bremerella cremea]
MSNLLYYHDRFLKHLTGSCHPEVPVRLTTAKDHLLACGIWDQWQHPDFSAANEEQLELVHDPGLIKYLRDMTSHGGGQIDEDTFASADSYKVALLTAGAASDATRQVISGKAKRAFCLSRPPGHHATRDQAMGFCLFNNVAVAAATAIEELELSRVLIVDWDVHHGNGTQDIFWRSENVGFFSMHRYPFYPDSGDRDARGEGPGLGYTLNLPITYGTDRQTILNEFAHRLQDFADKVRPELVLISAGFDAHKDDPVGDLGLEAEDFLATTQTVKEIADTWSHGRIVSLLEGGYNPPRLAECIEMHLRELKDDA